MSEYNLNITGDVSLSDYSEIHDYMGLVGINDMFKITMENNYNNNFEAICKLLRDNGFTITSNERQQDGKYEISSLRKK